jgi:hypothetical protein
MKIHVFPPSGRVVGIVTPKNYLALDCELKRNRLPSRSPGACQKLLRICIRGGLREMRNSSNAFVSFLFADNPRTGLLAITAAFGSINLTGPGYSVVWGWTRSHKKVKAVSPRGSKGGWRPLSNVVVIDHPRKIFYPRDQLR